MITFFTTLNYCGLGLFCTDRNTCLFSPTLLLYTIMGIIKELPPERLHLEAISEVCTLQSTLDH